MGDNTLVLVVHPVEFAQKGGLTAARRANKGRDLVELNLGTNIKQGLLGAVVIP